MVGYSRVKYEVFVLPRKTPQIVDPKIELETLLLPLNKVSFLQWKQLKNLQGCLGIFYLRWRYGSPDTRVLLVYAMGKLAHVQWIVPAAKIRGRYGFVPEKSYLIISCLTSVDFRGQRIYPSQLRKVVTSQQNENTYWIWADSTNISSIKGIYSAGGQKIGEFIQRKWLWGVISQVKYVQENMTKNENR